jgi:hypothetical protein
LDRSVQNRWDAGGRVLRSPHRRHSVDGATIGRRYFFFAGAFFLAAAFFAAGFFVAVFAAGFLAGFFAALVVLVAAIALHSFDLAHGEAVVIVPDRSIRYKRS